MNNKSLIIKLWELLQILNIVSAILYLLLFFIKKDLFYKVIEKVVSYGFPLSLIILLDSLSIIIFVGIERKAEFGYYASLIFIGVVIFSSLMDFVKLIRNNLISSLGYVIQILIFTILGYSIYKEKEFFIKEKN